jgi:hypothetical protein
MMWSASLNSFRLKLKVTLEADKVGSDLGLGWVFLGPNYLFFVLLCLYLFYVQAILWVLLNLTN